MGRQRLHFHRAGRAQWYNPDMRGWLTALDPALTRLIEAAGIENFVPLGWEATHNSSNRQAIFQTLAVCADL